MSHISCDGIKDENRTKEQKESKNLEFGYGLDHNRKQQHTGRSEDNSSGQGAKHARKRQKFREQRTPTKKLANILCEVQMGRKE